MESATILNIDKSRYLGHGCNDFDKMWHSDDAVPPSWPFWLLKNLNFENPRWRWPPSWKIYKSPYLGRGSSDFYEIWPHNTLYVHYMYEPQLSDFVRFRCIFCVVSFTQRVRIAGGSFWYAACNSVNRRCSMCTLLSLIVNTTLNIEGHQLQAKPRILNRLWPSTWK